MSKKIYLDLTKEEKHTCYLCYNFLIYASALGLRQQYNTRIMNLIFADLKDCNYIIVSEIRYLKEFYSNLNDIYRETVAKYGYRDCSDLELNMLKGIIDKIDKEINNE